MAFGGDGLIGAVAAALKHTDGVLGVLPGGRGNDFARVLGIPREPRAACGVLASGVRPGRWTSARSTAGRSSRIASCGFDSDANRIANETRLVRGNLVYAYGALRALVDLAAGDIHGSSSTAASTATFTGYTVAAANSKAYGGGMLLAPDASLEDGLLDVVMVAEVPKLRFLRLLPTVFKGAHVAPAERRGAASARASRSAPTGRSRCMPTATRSPSCPSRVRCAARRRQRAGPRHERARREDRRRARGRRARAARRPRRRHEPSRQGADPARAARDRRARGPAAREGRVVISATNGKTTTAAMAASVLERAGIPLVHNRAGANMAGGVASTLLAAARARAVGIDGELGLFEVDEFWLDRVAPELAAAGDPARQPVPRPARPLRRARDDRRPLGGGRRLVTGSSTSWC